MQCDIVLPQPHMGIAELCHEFGAQRQGSAERLGFDLFQALQGAVGHETAVLAHGFQALLQRKMGMGKRRQQAAQRQQP